MKAIVAVDGDEDPSISTLSLKMTGSNIDLTLQSDSSKSWGDPSKSRSNKGKGLSTVPPLIVQTADIQKDSREDHAKESRTDSEHRSKSRSPCHTSSSQSKHDDNLTLWIDGSMVSEIITYFERWFTNHSDTIR